MHIDRTARPRYITYVVDSQFVFLVDTAAPAPVRRDELKGLAAEDVASINVLKANAVPDSWHACEEVPVVLILTRSKRWRPPASAASNPRE